MSLTFTKIGDRHYAPVTDEVSLVIVPVGKFFQVHYMQRTGGELSQLHSVPTDFDRAKGDAEVLAEMVPVIRGKRR